MLTVDEVKKQLPMVKIKWGRFHYWGKVTGRLNKFATVSPYYPINHRKHNAPIMGQCFHFSWITVTDAINYNRELIAE